MLPTNDVIIDEIIVFYLNGPLFTRQIFYVDGRFFDLFPYHPSEMWRCLYMGCCRTEQYVGLRWFDMRFHQVYIIVWFFCYWAWTIQYSRRPKKVISKFKKRRQRRWHWLAAHICILPERHSLCQTETDTRDTCFRRPSRPTNRVRNTDRVHTCSVRTEGPTLSRSKLFVPLVDLTCSDWVYNKCRTAPQSYMPTNNSATFSPSIPSRAFPMASAGAELRACCKLRQLPLQFSIWMELPPSDWRTAEEDTGAGIAGWVHHPTACMCCKLLKLELTLHGLGRNVV